VHYAVFITSRTSFHSHAFRCLLTPSSGSPRLTVIQFNGCCVLNFNTPQCNTRFRNQQALSIVHITFFKKFSLKMAPEGRAETCSWEIWLKIHFNNCLTWSCVRLYILYCIFLYSYITTETQRGGLTWRSPENWTGRLTCELINTVYSTRVV